MTKYFLYARKSTDVEDKQVRSIDDQLAVLRALAKEQNIPIAQEFVERQSAAVRRAFELYAEGNWRLEDAANFLAEQGVRTKGGRPIKRDQVSYLLSNPFYYGNFRYGGDLYEGNHEPIISKALFDKVQAALYARSKPPKNQHNNPQALCGLIRCGTCGMGITAERKTKHQKNGNIHHYTYYRCSRKNKAVKCSEPPIREELLDTQLSSLLEPYKMPPDWATEINKMADRDEKEAAQSAAATVQKYKAEIQAISQKLQRLLDAYLDQDIERESYRSEKANLLSRKKSLEEETS